LRWLLTQKLKKWDDFVSYYRLLRHKGVLLSDCIRLVIKNSVDVSK